MNIICYAVLLGCFLSASSAFGGSLTLRDCLTQTAAENHSLKVAAYDSKLAEQSIVSSRSGYFPRVDFQGGYTAQLEPQSIQINNQSIYTQQADYGFFSFSAYQTIYDFGRTKARTDRAEALKDAVRFNYSGLEKDIFLQVVSAYFSILEMEKLLNAALDEETQMTDHLHVARNFFDQGVVTRNDVLQAEVRLSTSRQRRLDAANRLENAWLQLNYLTGQKPDFRATLQEQASIAPSAQQSGLERALTERPEIKAMKKTIEGSDQEVKESRGGYYPELFAKAGVDYVQNNTVTEQAIWSATAGLKINLFDGLATTSRYRQSILNRSRNEEALRQLEAGIRLEYQTAVNDARVAFERIGAAEKSIQQGEENLRINRDRYESQVGTATDVIDAQTLLTQTRTDYYRAVFDYQVALARVRKALGEL